MVLQLFSANSFVLCLDSLAKLREKIRSCYFSMCKYGENESHLSTDPSIKILRIYTTQIHSCLDCLRVKVGDLYLSVRR